MPVKLALIPAFVVDFLAFNATGYEASIEAVLGGINSLDFYAFWLNREINRRWVITSFHRAQRWLTDAQFYAGFAHHAPIIESETYEGKLTNYRLRGKVIRVHKKRPPRAV